MSEVVKNLAGIKMLQQPPVTHPQDMLHVHKRKLDWLSLFVIDKSFMTIICHLSAPQAFCLFISNFFTGNEIKLTSLCPTSPSLFSFHNVCPFLMFRYVT